MLYKLYKGRAVIGNERDIEYVLPNLNCPS